MISIAVRPADGLGCRLGLKKHMGDALAEASFGRSRAMSKGVKVSSFSLTKKEIYSTTAVFGSQHFIILNTLGGFTKIFSRLLTEKQTGLPVCFLIACIYDFPPLPTHRSGCYRDFLRDP